MSSAKLNYQKNVRQLHPRSDTILCCQWPYRSCNRKTS